MSDEEEIREAVDEAKAPGSFNIVSVLQNRNYPKTEVNILIDDSLAYEASAIQERINELDKAIGKNKMSAEQQSEREVLIERKEEVYENIAKGLYVVEISGISEGVREGILTRQRNVTPFSTRARTISRNCLAAKPRRSRRSPSRGTTFSLISCGRRALPR